MHVLERPTASDEFAGQPIEQFGMRRPAAVVSEVGGRFDDAAAEMVVPQAVDHHAGRQRVLRLARSSWPARRVARAREPSRESRAGRRSRLPPGFTTSRGEPGSPRYRRWTGAGCSNVPA